MNELETIEYINSLLDIYEDLLASSQREIADKYYRFNLSISEISEELKISRAAVNDALKKAKMNLENYEKTLHVFKDRNDVIETLENIKEELSDSKKEKVELLERRLKNGI